MARLSTLATRDRDDRRPPGARVIRAPGFGGEQGGGGRLRGWRRGGGWVGAGAGVGGVEGGAVGVADHGAVIDQPVAVPAAVVAAVVAPAQQRAGGQGEPALPPVGHIQVGDVAPPGRLITPRPDTRFVAQLQRPPQSGRDVAGLPRHFQRQPVLPRQDRRDRGVAEQPAQLVEWLRAGVDRLGRPARRSEGVLADHHRHVRRHPAVGRRVPGAQRRRGDVDQRVPGALLGGAVLAGGIGAAERIDRGRQQLRVQAGTFREQPHRPLRRLRHARATAGVLAVQPGHRRLRRAFGQHPGTAPPEHHRILHHRRREQVGLDLIPHGTGERRQRVGAAPQMLDGDPPRPEQPARTLGGRLQGPAGRQRALDLPRRHVQIGRELTLHIPHRLLRRPRLIGTLQPGRSRPPARQHRRRLGLMGLQAPDRSLLTLEQRPDPGLVQLVQPQPDDRVHGRDQPLDVRDGSSRHDGGHRLPLPSTVTRTYVRS
jgi:hypothetical protein